MTARAIQLALKRRTNHVSANRASALSLSRGSLRGCLIHCRAGRVGAVRPAAARVDLVAAVHGTRGTAAIRARSRRSRVGPHRHERQHDLRRGREVHAGAVWQRLRRQRRRVEGRGARPCAAVLGAVPQNRLVLVGRAGADVSAATLTALKGRRIAIVEGYAYGPAIEGAGPDFGRTSGEEDSIRQLLAGTVDFALIDELVANYIVEHHPEEAKKRLQLGTTPLVTRQLFFTVNRARADAQAIVNRFNAQLRGMIADRTYHRLLHVESISADVNGDGTPEYVPQSDKVGTMSRRAPT